MGGNKYNAKTEVQLKFSEIIEKELGFVCDFDKYFITRGRGWANKYGSCSASVAIRPNNVFSVWWLSLYISPITKLFK